MGRRSLPGRSGPGAAWRRIGSRVMREALRTLTTRRLDGRSAVAVAVRRWREDVRADLGGDLTRAQETILVAARSASSAATA